MNEYLKRIREKELKNKYPAESKKKPPEPIKEQQ